MASPTAGQLSRRTLLAAGVALPGAALAGCGAGSQANQAAATGPVEGAIRLLTPVYDGADGKKLLEGRLLPEFRKLHPKVTVTVDYTTYGKLNEKITTALASGAPPDLMMMGVGWIEPFAARHVLRAVSPPADLSRTYPKDILDSCRYRGTLYALPVMVDTRFGVYRRDLLADAGFDAPPSTMDELRAAAVKLTVRRGGRLTRTGLDILSLDTRQMFETVLFSMGGTLFRDGRPTFNDSTGVAALRWLTDLQRRYRVIDAGFTSSATTSLPIADGRAAMAIGHNNWWTAIGQTHPEVRDRIAPFMLNGEHPAIFAGGTLVTVSAASRHPAAAQALATYLAGPDQSLAASRQRGNVPAALSSRDSGYVKGDPLVRFALANMAHAHHEGGTPAWLTIRGDFEAAIQSALLGRKTPKAALDELAAGARSAIADATS